MAEAYTNRSMYDHLETCPEELVLFFYRLPYSYRLKSGKKLLQHIYDTHFEGVEDVQRFVEEWKELKGHIPDDAFDRVSEKLVIQEAHAKEWRDVINTYFFNWINPCGLSLGVTLLCYEISITCD